MILKYNIDIANDTIQDALKRITNQIYKLLPLREESADWVKPLQTIIEELVGMDRLFNEQQTLMFPLLCKLEGLFRLAQDDDFMLYRRVIFECLNLINKVIQQCQN